MIERSLVLLKPDSVQRGFMGEIITRFERAGLKIVGMKMVWADEEFVKNHYTEDITERHGEHIRKALLKMITMGPIVAIAIEGVKAIAVVRKIVGSTEPHSAPPGTIRGDYSHVNYGLCDDKDQAIRNLIHASADEKDAEVEMKLWFKDDELHTYKTVHDQHILHE